MKTVKLSRKEGLATAGGAMKITSRKKAQEEMVGLVVIMLIVAVIFVIFLGIYLRQKSVEERGDDPGVSQFLDALIAYTTDCNIAGYPQNIEYLIVKCSENAGLRCNDGRAVCGASGILKSVSSGIIKESWNMSSGGAIIGTTFKADFISTSGTESNIVEDLQGPCVRQKVRGAQKPLSASGGKIILTLEVCE